jgi:hypothetical protein
MADKSAVDFKVDPLPSGTSTPPDSERSDEEQENGTLTQHILKNGEQVLVTWRKEEEARIVRKVDFLFLPVFSVGFTLNLLLSLSCSPLPADVHLDGH